ncbi:hypothetical protein ANN_13427 [Periplaneta americana]|uniref:Uncharacterized protein n=1 Tax=Periplaneta americana TaxID=6978 RepID=A0ABQ8TMW5_PERAM|nr:hypothetical protein ANN_13427 [Periplaneta americana]
MSPGSNTESYPAFARIGLRENPGKNLNQITCPDRDSNPGHLVSRPDALTVTPQAEAYCIGHSVSNKTPLSQTVRCDGDYTHSSEAEPYWIGQSFSDRTLLSQTVRCDGHYTHFSDTEAYCIGHIVSDRTLLSRTVRCDVITHSSEAEAYCIGHSVSDRTLLSWAVRCDGDYRILPRLKHTESDIVSDRTLLSQTVRCDVITRILLRLNHTESDILSRTGRFCLGPFDVKVITRILLRLKHTASNRVYYLHYLPRIRVRGAIAYLLRNKGWEVHEEVHCISEDDSHRRADTIAINRQQQKALIIDPTIRMERDLNQAHQVDHEIGPFMSLVFLTLVPRDQSRTHRHDTTVHDVIRLLIPALYKNQSDSLMAADGDCHHLCKLMAPVRQRWSINDVIGGIRNTVMPSDCSPVRFGIRSLESRK